MSEPREIEVKLCIADVAAVRAALVRVWAELVRARHFEDNVLFDDRPDHAGR